MQIRASGNRLKGESCMGSELLELKRWSRKGDRRVRAIRLVGSKSQEELLLFGEKNQRPIMLPRSFHRGSTRSREMVGCMHN
jgi:hypothetical protein